MTDKVELSLIHTAPIINLPIASAEYFRRLVLEDGCRPSVALRKMMREYDISFIDSSVPIQLLEITYPEIDLARQGFRFRVIDSAYPNGDVSQFGDAEFDSGVADLLLLPPEVW